jgi:hypothetical protein
MRLVWAAFLACLLLNLFAQAKEPKFYQQGKILRMDSVSCGTAEKSGKTFAGELLGTDSANRKIKETLCQEYVVQAQRVSYRIRPVDEKHPVLLPVGEVAEFRIHKDKLYLKVKELDGKERDYAVVSMVPVETSSTPGSGN